MIVKEGLKDSAATKCLFFGLFLSRGCTHSPVLAQKSNQNTSFSATLDFSSVFRWFSAFSPTLCTVVYRFLVVASFLLWFFKTKQQLGFLKLFTSELRAK